MCFLFRLIQHSLEAAAQAAAALGTPSSGRSPGQQPSFPVAQHPGCGGEVPILAAPRGSPLPDPLTLLHCTALHLAALHGHAHVVEALLTSPRLQRPRLQRSGPGFLYALWQIAHAAQREWSPPVKAAHMMPSRRWVPAFPAQQSRSLASSDVQFTRGRSPVTALGYCSTWRWDIDPQGATALHVAAREGWPGVIAALASVPAAELDAADAGGRTPLHHAAALGRAEAVNELWSRNAKLELPDASGWSGGGLPSNAAQNVYVLLSCSRAMHAGRCHMLCVAVDSVRLCVGGRMLQLRPHEVPCTARSAALCGGGGAHARGGEPGDRWRARACVDRRRLGARAPGRARGARRRPSRSCSWAAMSWTRPPALAAGPRCTWRRATARLEVFPLPPWLPTLQSAQDTGWQSCQLPAGAHAASRD